MRSTLASFKRDISDMRDMISAIGPASALLAVSTEATIKSYLAVRRRFDYSALIVALYAAYETFVEELLTSYVTALSQQTAYSALPQNLQKQHMKRTGELLSKIELDSGRHPGVTTKSLVENLHNCLSGSMPYFLNHSAIVVHDANFRVEELTKILGLIEIKPDMVRRDQNFIAWYHDDQEMQGNLPDVVPEPVVKQRLDELVERRNEVAHRGSNPENRLGADEMQKLVGFVDALSRSIFALIVARYLSHRYIASAQCSKLTVVKGPFKQKRVRVVEWPTTKLFVGQPAFALSSAGLARWGRITSLQVADVDQTEVDPGRSGLVGIETDFPAPASMEVFTLPTDDDLVWEPLTGSS